MKKGMILFLTAVALGLLANWYWTGSNPVDRFNSLIGSGTNSPTVSIEQTSKKIVELPVQIADDEIARIPAINMTPEYYQRIQENGISCGRDRKAQPEVVYLCWSRGHVGPIPTRPERIY